MRTLALTMFFFAYLSACDANAAKWIKTSVEDWSIDVETMEVIPNGLVRFWNRYKLNPEVVADLDRDLKLNGTAKDYSDYSFSVALWEVSCSKRLHRVIVGTDYSSKGIGINSFDTEKTMALSRVIPSSDFAAVFDETCRLIRENGKRKK